MGRDDLLQELHRFISATDLGQVVFRSDHASNYLALKGMLGRDKQDLLRQIRTALESPGSGRLRQEWERGL
jgi:hypothetical protein